MKFVAFERKLQGTGASRRLRHAGKVPGIVYGAGEPADIGGYFRPDPEKAAAVMRPSSTLNDALASLG